MNVDAQTKARLREMGAAELVRSLEAQGDSACMGMAFADGVFCQLALSGNRIAF